MMDNWWIAISVLVSCIVARIEIISADSEFFSVSYKLVIILLSTVFFYVLSQTLCTKSTSLNTQRIIPSTQNQRDPSLKYCVLRIQSDESTFEWVKEAHMEYLDMQMSQNKGNHAGANTVARTVDKYHIFQFVMHLNRFLSTIQNIQIPTKMLRRIFIVHLRDGLDEFYDDCLVNADEARILIHIDSNRQLVFS